MIDVYNHAVTNILGALVLLLTAWHIVERTFVTRREFNMMVERITAVQETLTKILLKGDVK